MEFPLAVHFAHQRAAAVSLARVPSAFSMSSTNHAVGDAAVEAVALGSGEGLDEGLFQEACSTGSFGVTPSSNEASNCTT